ncbi:MAG: hypothetical protein IIC61_07525 [Proteobacteria bacterium]|nr:hypothetical protein [Pseudomonadota bacterium]
MMRSPLFYPLNRGMDAEGGGVADLQADVMRFMAILSLCLMAIFALVQSIPLAPVVHTTEIKIVELPVEQSAPPKPVVTAAREIKLTRPQPQRLPPPAQAIASVEAAPVEADPLQQGFTLRFEDDITLNRLVARNEVGLYAIFPEKSFRMNVNRGQMSFWPASVPKQFHEMDASTVPDPVIEAFKRSNGSRVAGLQWGVTIPSRTARQLEQYLREASGGALIIDADGDLRLER